MPLLQGHEAPDIVNIQCLRALHQASDLHLPRFTLEGSEFPDVVFAAAELVKIVIVRGDFFFGERSIQTKSVIARADSVRQGLGALLDLLLDLLIALTTRQYPG